MNYWEPAYPEDVLHEQLDYLNTHQKEHGDIPACRDCQRAREVKHALLVPFQERSQPAKVTVANA